MPSNPPTRFAKASAVLAIAGGATSSAVFVDSSLLFVFPLATSGLLIASSIALGIVSWTMKDFHPLSYLGAAVPLYAIAARCAASLIASFAWRSLLLFGAAGFVVSLAAIIAIRGSRSRWIYLVCSAFAWPTFLVEAAGLATDRALSLAWNLSVLSFVPFACCVLVGWVGAQLGSDRVAESRTIAVLTICGAVLGFCVAASAASDAQPSWLAAFHILSLSRAHLTDRGASSMTIAVEYGAASLSMLGAALTMLAISRTPGLEPANTTS